MRKQVKQQHCIGPGGSLNSQICLQDLLAEISRFLQIAMIITGTAVFSSGITYLIIYIQQNERKFNKTESILSVL